MWSAGPGSKNLSTGLDVKMFLLAAYFMILKQSFSFIHSAYYFPSYYAWPASIS